MKIRIIDNNHQTEVTELFTSVFTASEGEEEGKLIGKLASELSSSIDNKEIICIGAYESDSLVGAIFFTRLHFKDKSQIYMLAPVAVSTEHQGKSVGQALITSGLNEMKSRSVSVVITYGDPAYYSKVGFQSLSEGVIQAPLTLSMPFGWQGQSLTEEAIPTLNDRPTCVEPFNDSVYW